MQRIGKHVLMTMVWILLLLYLLGGALRPTDNPTPAVAQSVPAPTPTALATTPPVTPAQVNRSVYLPVMLRGAGILPTPVPPQQAGTARYVRVDWPEFESEPLVGEDEPARRRIAFARGYNAFAGEPGNTIILAFGRQLEPGRILADGTVLDDTWHVLIIDDKPVTQRAKARSWVVNTALYFIRGYLQNPDHPAARIAIGTSNANYAWDCSNRGAGSVDEGDYWHDAGAEWRATVQDINSRLAANEKERVTLVGANDVESWFGEPIFWETEDANGDPLDPPEQAWIGCAAGVRKWLDGWEAASMPADPPPVINFGSNAWSEVQGIGAGDLVGGIRARFDFGDQWTRDDLLEVTGKHPTRRRPYIRVYPQIYCPGQEQTWVEFTEWTITNRTIVSPLFDGVTSEDAGSFLCGNVAGLTWEESWLTLNDALLASDAVTNAQIRIPLRRLASSFYHSQLGRDEP